MSKNAYLNPLVPVTSIKHGYRTVYEHRLELTLTCGHGEVRWVKTGSTHRPTTPKRVRCSLCGQESRDARVIFIAVCETCDRGKVPLGRRSMHYVRLSDRKVSRDGARQHAIEHKGEFPDHQTSVMEVG